MSTILIAYEREMEQIALERLLTERGHTVVRAGNGVDALDAARREPPQLVISDIRLPKMDGFALCKKWKQDERLQTIPFVFYTRRHDDPKYERFAFELSADRYIERSTDNTVLLKAVEDLTAPGVSARMLDTLRLQAMATGSFTQTSRIAAAQPVTVTAPAPAPAETSPAASAPAPAASGESDERGLAREARLVARVSELDTQNKQLQASEQRFRQLFESSPVPQWLLQGDDRQCTAVNAAALTLYGFSRDEFLALPRNEPPFSPGAGIAGSNATWHRTKSGSAIAIETATRPIDLGGKRCELVAAHDWTQRIFDVQATAHAAEAYQAILVAAADGIWLLDDQRKLLDVNQAYCQMSGFTREELLKFSPAELLARIDGGGAPNLRELLGQESSQEQVSAVVLKRKDGGTHTVDLSIGALTGARSRTVVVLRAAERREVEARAHERQLLARQSALDLMLGAADLDVGEIVRRAAEVAAKLTESPLAYVSMADDSLPVPALLSVYEESRGIAVAIGGESRKLSKQGASAECLKRGQALFSDNGKFAETTAALPQQRALLAMPILHHAESLGAIVVANAAAGYREGQQTLLSPLAQALGTLLVSKRTQAQTLIAAQRADLALQGIIEGLSRVVERHDPYDAGGPRRVATLAVAIAREMNLSQEQQNALRTAGLLHGVGNVAIPAALFAKPGPLTPAELALVRTHVEEGRKILSEIEFSSPIGDIVYQHHERLDGSGYPRGVKGDQIMLEARILAVADVVEAMCAVRPHRLTPGVDAALAELEKGADRKYDGHAVRACLALFREQGFKFAA